MRVPRRLPPGLRRLPTAAVVTALAIAAGGCSGSAASSGSGTTGAAFPVTVAAANGPVHLSKRPTAIISLAPSATEMLYAIGAGHQIKAVDKNSDFPTVAPRTKLSGQHPNIGAIVAEKPDLVVVSHDAAALTRRLASFSIPVLALPAPASVADVYTELDQLGQATGNLVRARQEVASLRSQIGQIAAEAPHHARPITYYYELDRAYHSVTSSTFIGKLLGLLGMRSIADAAKGATAGGSPRLSAKFVVKANPDYIILADTICCHQDARTVRNRPGWSRLAAVKSGHIILLGDDIASRWGPRIVTLLSTVLAGINGGR